MRSTHPHSLIRSLQRKGCKKEIVIHIRLYDLVTSTTLASHKRLMPFIRGVTLHHPVCPAVVCPLQLSASTRRAMRHVPRPSGRP